MVYKMRFVQYFDKKDTNIFGELEKKFIELEKLTPELKVGRRYMPVIGREPTNTMIWEAEYNSVEEAVATLKILEENQRHDELLDEQINYMRDSYVEIYKQIE